MTGCADIDCKVEMTEKIGEVEADVSKRLSVFNFIVWISALCFIFIGAMYTIDQKVGDCAKTADMAEVLSKINDKLDRIQTDTSEIKVSQKNTEQYIAETKKRDAKQESDIRDLQLENARGH